MMKKNIKYSIAILFILSCFYSVAYSANLIDSYQAAITYNANYLKILSDNEASQQQQNMAFAQLFPQLSLNSQYNQNYTHQDNLDLSYHQPQVSISVSQAIFDWSKLSQYSKLKYGVKVADARSKNSKQQLFLSVAQAYYNVLYAKDSLKALENSQIALQKQLSQSKAYFDAGGATMADIADAQAAFDLGASQVIQSQNEIISKSNVYENLTGLSASDIYPLKSNILIQAIQKTGIESINKLAHNNNYGLKIAQLQVEMAKQDLSAAHGQFGPTVGLTGSYGYQWTGSLDAISGSGAAAAQQVLSVPGGQLSSGSTAQVGLQVSMPLFTSGSLASQSKQMVAQLDSSTQSMISTSRTLDQNINTDYWSVKNNVAIFVAQKQALASAKLKLISDTLGVKAGVRNAIDLVNSQKNYAQVEQSYAQSRYQFMMSQIQLQYDLSCIDEDFIKNINSNIESRYIL